MYHREIDHVEKRTGEELSDRKIVTEGHPGSFSPYACMLMHVVCLHTNKISTKAANKCRKDCKLRLDGLSACIDRPTMQMR